MADRTQGLVVGVDTHKYLPRLSRCRPLVCVSARQRSPPTPAANGVSGGLTSWPRISETGAGFRSRSAGVHPETRQQRVSDAARRQAPPGSVRPDHSSFWAGQTRLPTAEPG